MCNHTATTVQATDDEKRCRAAVEADSENADAWRGLGIALLLRSGGGGGKGASSSSSEEAVACLRRALRLSPTTTASSSSSRAGTRHALGLALLRSGDAAAAADELERACALRPGDARPRADLARALKEAGRLGAAAEAYRAAIRLQDEEEEGGNKEQARPLLPLHYRLGMTLRAMLSSPRHCRSAAQRRRVAREARACFATQLREDPGHALAAFWLAALDSDDGGGDDDDDEAAAAAAAKAKAKANAAAGCPPGMVAALFDKYAPSFDAHLVGELEYQTPRRLADALFAAAAGSAVSGEKGGSKGLLPLRRVADLGCGTGLMGPLLRPMMAATGHLCGVDLSPRMLDVAREKGGRGYDALHVGEMVAWLQERQHSSSSSSSSADDDKTSLAGGFDALVAADVCVYLGDLAPVLEAAAAACSGPGALFAFSTEDADAGAEEEGEGHSGDGEGEGDAGKEKGRAPPGDGGGGGGFVLRATGRYAHSAAYLERRAAAAGWAVASLERRSPLRMNAGVRIWGNLVVLRRV